MSTILYKQPVLRAEELKERSYLGLPNQLLPTLEELSTEELRRFQLYLTGGQLPGLPPVPESQLKRAGWRKTVVTPQKYSPENAVKITVGILRRMNRKDLIEKLERDHRGSTHASASTLPHSASSVGQSSILTSPSQRAEGTLQRGTCLVRGLDLLKGGSARKRRRRYRPKILTGSLKKRKQEGPTMLSVPNLLLETLEKLNRVKLKRFQWHLTEDVLDKLPPIPESQLKNSDWQDTVDQIMQTYGPEKAVEITVVVLRLLYRKDLAEVLERSHRGAQGALHGKVANVRLNSLRHTNLQDEHVPVCSYRGSREKSPSFKKSETTWNVSLGILTPASSTISCSCSESDLEEEHIQLVGSPSALDREASDTKAVDSLSKPATPYQFEPKTCENKGTYWFQCPHAGLFQCSITGLVFEMEGEGEVLYWTVPWNRKLLAQRGKRPAGPLFKFTCPQGSVGQLHLPHCELYDQGGCEFLSVAHVTDDKKVEFIDDLELTNTHVIINVTGFSKYGIVSEEGKPITPIDTLVLLFYQLPDVVKRSILKVLLLPSNVVLKEVLEERRSRNGDREIYLETTSHCQLTPKQEYTLSTDLTDNHRIKPTKASFVHFQSYENYIPTFQLFMQSIVKEANIFLNENGSDEFIWDGLVWLPASPTEFTSTVLAPPPATPSIPPGRAFITKHRMALEIRMGVLRPILLRLQQPDQGVLTGEEIEEVLNLTKKTLQNQALLNMVIRKGARAQEYFYQALREADPCLVEDLEEPTS
nr:NACHT, LRR and PYD domains-containing protein 1-like isoform X1 [Oncorhynchus nerka]XP_029538136.1 NACHT, LRR and PYD domains-containing protein 1-like isoform X1 [Oncorhynchus nerka]